MRAVPRGQARVERGCACRAEEGESSARGSIGILCGMSWKVQGKFTEDILEYR